MNIIEPEELEFIMMVRDLGMYRINAATNIRQKQLNAKDDNAYESITIPRIFPFNDKSCFIKSKDDQKHETNNFLMDAYCRGLNMRDDYGNLICRYGNLGAVAINDVYRGENRDYGSTSGKSSLGRTIASLNQKDALVEFYISQMRILLFKSFLEHFEQYTNFPFGTPMPHVIAQHYGIPTQFLDLTDDVKVALFFACCKHIGNDQYLPIGEDDISDYGEYAVLYHGYGDQYITTIGYQPFSRCFMQRGYCLDTASQIPCWEYSLQNNSNFTKSLFRRNPKLCKQICEEFDGGEQLFPKDSLHEFKREINEISHIKKFPLQVFDIIYDCFKSYYKHYSSQLPIKQITKKNMLNELEIRGIEFDSKVVISGVNLNRINQLNNQWNPKKYKLEHGILGWGREVVPCGEGFWISRGKYGMYCDE